MKKNKTLKGALTVLLALILMLALIQTASAEIKVFPLLAKNGDLVADELTQYITEIKQDTASKMITASVMIKNGNSVASAKSIKISGVSLVLSFTDKICPYRYNPVTDGNNHPYDMTRMYQGAINTTAAEFKKYCYLPNEGFDTVGSVGLQNNASNRFIGATITAATTGNIMTVAAGATVTVAQLFFMPANGTDNLDISMFKFQFYNQSSAPGLMATKLYTWLGNGTVFLYPYEDKFKPSRISEDFVINTSSFKINVVKPQPAVSANNTARTVSGYDAATMEWSASASGPWTSAAPTAADIGTAAKTIYVRVKGDTAYSGSDDEYVDYKMYLSSEPLAVVFSGGGGGSTTVTVTFNHNYGTPPTTQNVSVTYTAPATSGTVGSQMPADPSRSGFTFQGWNTAADGSGTPFNSATPVSANITVYAQWQSGGGGSTTVTVTFNHNYGTPPTTQNVSVTYTAPATSGTVGTSKMPANPSRSGYIFNGWNTAANGSGSSFTASTPVSVDIEVFAQWRNTVTVTFIYNHTAVPGSTTVTTDLGTALGAKMPANPAAPAGWMFRGWGTSKVGEPNFTSGTPVNGDITVYGLWKDLDDPGIPPLVVTFNANDGSFGGGATLKSVTVTKKSAAGDFVVGSDMPSEPTRSGYKFLNWHTHPLGNNLLGYFFVPLTPVVRDITVYALWEEDKGPGQPPGGGTTDEKKGTGTIIYDQQTPLGQVPPGFTTLHIPFINGYPDNTFKPDAAITRAEAAMIFFRLLISPAKENPLEPAFKDVAANAWYTQAVSYLASIDVITGYPDDGTFRPNKPITRAEFAAIASRFDNLTEREGTIFPDVAGHWAEKYINSAYARGWVSGYPEDGTFRPQKSITRAEVVTIVNRMLNRKLRVADMPEGILANVKKFTDVEGHWAYAEIIEAANDHDFTRRSDGFETWTALK